MHHPGLTIPLALVTLLLGGCVFTPDGTRQELDRAAADGAPFKDRFETRQVPDLPTEPTWRDVLRRAFLTSGELEAAYFEWRAALDRIDIAGTWPNSDVELGFDYMFSEGSMKAFDRTTIAAGFHPAESLSFPTKTAQAAKVALEEARQAGARFRSVKFDVQKQILTAWAGYIERDREIQAKRDELALRKTLAHIGSIRGTFSSGQQSIVESDIAARLAQSDLDDMLADQASMRAMINALLQRAPDAPLQAARDPAPPRRIPGTDAELIALAVETFPDVQVFAHEVSGKREALELARMRWIPDLSPTFSVTGTIIQTIGAAVTLPTTIPAIRASIRESDAELRAAEAMLRQRRAERMGDYVGLLLALRRAESKLQLFRSTIQPAAQRLADARTRAYEAGSADFSDVIESRQLLLDTRVTIARAEATIEKSIVDIECCLGLDIETLEKRSQP